LAELPKTLDETYERTLREINEADWELAHRLFQCVAVASRPFRVEELAEFLAFDFSAGPIPQFRDDWRLEDPVDAVLSTCSTLLSLVDHRDSTVIQFSHFSVKEFLISTRFAEKHDTISLCYHISLTHAHTLVTQACLGILLHLDKNITRDSLTNFPLAAYAAEHWVYHARFDGVSQNAEEGIKQLLDASKPHLAIWVWIFEPYWRWRHEAVEKPPSPSGTPLHYAAICGLHHVVKFLAIEHPEQIHSRCGDNGATPLYLASRQGHLEAARFLVECGADVTAEDRDGWTALHVASLVGHLDLARLLTERGADVTARGEGGSTPLHIASHAGDLDLAQLLIEHGTDMTDQDDDGCTALHVASLEGHLDLAQLLIERGADVTAQSRVRATPLHVASSQGHLDLARLFIERGANVTAQDEDGLTPLHVVSSRGDLDLAQLLIERGANMTDQDEGEWTALHVALSRGHLDLARLLIRRGADVTAQSKDGTTPLHVASSKGYSDLARLLIERGADMTAQDEDGWTALHGASSKGHLDLARLLIERGAGVTAQDED